MNHLIRTYDVCPLVFEILVLYSLDEAFFEKNADVNVVVCFLALILTHLFTAMDSTTFNFRLSEVHEIIAVRWTDLCLLT